MSRFPERLKELRLSHDLSQQELANQLRCVSKSSINMYERGEREPSIDTLESIADYFNVDMDYLLGKSDIPNRYCYSESRLNEKPTSSREDEVSRRLRAYNSIQRCQRFILDNFVPVAPEITDHYDNFDNSESNSISFFLYDSNGSDYEFDIHCVGNEIDKMWALLKAASKVPIEHLDMARIMLESIPKTYKDSE